MMRLHRHAPEFHRVVGRVSDARRRRLGRSRIRHQIALEVFVRNDRDPLLQKFVIIAGVVLMVVRQKHELDGLVGDALDQIHQLVVIAFGWKLAVYQDNAFTGHADAGISARAGDHIEPWFNFLNGLSLISAAFATTFRLGECSSNGGQQEEGEQDLSQHEYLALKNTPDRFFLFDG